MEHKLHKPVEIDGEMVEAIEYDFDSITGQTVAVVIRDLQKRKHSVTLQEFDIIFHAALFAKAAGMHTDDIMPISAKDYTAVSVLVRDFFYLDSEDGQE